MAPQVKVATEIANDTVQLKRVYKATAEQVYQAWTNPDSLNKWFGPRSHTAKVEKFDLREGGGYQIRMTPVEEEYGSTGDENGDSVCAGQFLKLILNKALVMTFNWIEGGEDMGETLLSIEIASTSHGTEVILTHERIPSNESRKAHADGWGSSLECFEEFIQG
jgi:uncharacterized protein YndB with AHSA1/START domain